jgi:hypothetical protein
MALPRRLVRVISFGCLLANTACYAEIPIDSAVPPPETHVIAEVTDSGTVAMSNLIGPGAIAIEGVITNATPSSWEMAMLTGRNREGGSGTWNNEVVAFPRSVLSRPRERRLDTTRSWIAAGAVAVTAILAAQLFDVVGGGDEVTPPPVPPAQILRPGSGTP